MDYGEHRRRAEVHAAVQREKREPRVGREPLSIWLIAVYGLAVFFGGAYLGRYSGNFSGDSARSDTARPPTTKKARRAAGGAEQAAELSPHDRGKKDFRSQLSDLPSSQRPRVCQANIRRWPVRSLQRRLAPHGDDCAQRTCKARSKLKANSSVLP